MEEHPIWTRKFIVMCISSFFMFLNFYMLATTLPLYVKDILHGSQQQMGLVITIYMLGTVLFRPFSGQWADRFGKKLMAILGLSLFCLVSVLYLSASGIVFLLLLRFLHGASYGIASTASSAIASDLVPNARKGEGIGYFSMFMSIAMVVGPAFGLILWGQTNETVLLTASLITALLALLFALAARTPRSTPNTNPENRLQETARGKPWSNLIEKKAVPISLAGFVLAFSYSSLTAFISSFAIEIHQAHITSYFFICFAILIVFPRPLIGKIFDKYNEDVLVYPGLALFSTGMLLLSQAHSGFVLLLAGALMGLGHGALIPSFQTLAMKLAPPHRRALAIGTFFLLFDLGYGAGSYVLGLIATVTNYRFMFMFAGLLVALSALLYYQLHHRVRTKETLVS